MDEQNTQKPLVEEIPDPTGRIARAVKALKRDCLVRQSPLCEWIISRRLAGDSYPEISEGLQKFGRQYWISKSTIHRNLQRTELDKHVPQGVLIAEGYGGDLEIDVVREVSLQILSQRQRV